MWCTIIYGMNSETGKRLFAQLWTALGEGLSVGQTLVQPELFGDNPTKPKRHEIAAKRAANGPARKSTRASAFVRMTWSGHVAENLD